MHLNEENGPYQSFYENGEIESEGNYQDAFENGEWKYYWANKQLQEKSTFNAGRYEGASYRYDSTGVLIKTIQYINGKPQN
jgi:antitoxin component YwqK of YwqJK toxin-antitoxin module